MEYSTCAECGVDEAERILTLSDFAFGEPGEFPLVRCRQCGLMYLNPRPSPEQMNRYYPASYLPYKSAIEDERWAIMRWARRRNIQRYRQVVEQLSPRVPGRILDVGCSTGIFLAEMRDAGWEATGVDPSPTAIAYARQRFGLRVFEGQLADAGLAAEQFTAATLWDVLEHTFDPLETLQTLHQLLETDGIVVITIPHYESWDRLIFGRLWIGYDAPRHLYVFTRANLCSILKQAGFEVESMRCAFGGYFTTVASLRLWFNVHVRTLVLRKALNRLISIHGVRFLFSPWDLLVDTIGRGNKLEVIGRKVIK